MQRDDIAVYVAESKITQGRVLGYIIGSMVSNIPGLPMEHHGYVTELAVDSHGKAGGIGRNLFDALKAWFRERHVTHIEARVPARHPVAQAFWRALGASELFEQMWLKLE